MPVEVRVPPLGESVTEATVASWLKRVGDVVEAGEPLVELETDKVNVDVAAERSGVLTQVVHDTGATVHPGDVLAMVSESGGVSETDGQASDQANGQTAVVADAAGAVATSASASSVSSPAMPPPDRPHASPVARRMADEHGLDLAQVAGSGTGGRVTREDVEQFLAAQRTAAPPPTQGQVAAPLPSSPSLGSSGPGQAGQAASGAGAAPGARPTDPRGEERTRMSRRRQTIAMRLLEAQR